MSIVPLDPEYVARPSVRRCGDHVVAIADADRVDVRLRRASADLLDLRPVFRLEDAQDGASLRRRHDYAAVLRDRELGDVRLVEAEGPCGAELPGGLFGLELDLHGPCEARWDHCDGIDAGGDRKGAVGVLGLHGADFLKVLCAYRERECV